MRIRVFDSVSSYAGRPDDLDIEDPLDVKHVRVSHGAFTYELAVDSHGRLTLRDTDGHQISVAPIASNTVEIRSDNWAPANRRKRGE